MATLTVQTAAANSSTGLTFSTLNLATFTASSSNGDKITNTGNQVIMFSNSTSQGAGSSVTVTFTAVQSDNYGASASTHNVTVTVPSSSAGITIVGPFRPTLYNDSTGFLNWTYSAAGLNVAVLAIAPQS